MQNKSPNLEDVRAYIEHKAGAIRRPNGKFLRRAELRMAARVSRRLKAQEDWLVESMKSLPFLKDEGKGLRVISTKIIYDDIDDLLSRFPFEEDMVEEIIAVARSTYKKGAKQGAAELLMSKFGISFEVVNDRAVEYLKRLKDLHLSDYRGSITRQTKDRIRKILTESAETGRSYNETARLIRDQGKAGVFSKARGELIAINQVGHAYGQGNMDIVDEFITQTGSIVQKYWQTVNDGRVTPECQANQDKGWIGFNEAFPSGDENAPRDDNPRCRCATTFRTVDAQGNPT